MSFSLSTLTCSPVTVFWTLFFCNFYFFIVSGVDKRFVSDDNDDDDDDDGDEDGDNDDGDHDNNDDDDDDKDDDNDDGDKEDDDNDDDDWLLFCNCNKPLHLANWFNNEFIISSLDFICFHRKYTSSSMWAINVLEPTFSNESNTLSLNDLIYQNLQSNLFYNCWNFLADLNFQLHYVF